MDISNKYPRLAISKPQQSARFRPVYAYLDQGQPRQHETANRAVTFHHPDTKFLRGRVDPDISVKLFGKTYQAPFGVRLSACHH